MRAATKVPVSPAENQLIESLPRAHRRLLQALCEPVDWVLGEVLIERGQPTRHVHFPVDGFVSLVTQLDDHGSIEVGMIGREGMLGINLLLGVRDAPQRALVQGAGAAWQVPAREFADLVAHSAPLREVLNRYLYVLLAQQAEAAACLKFHAIGPRLARWLLMSHDRAHADRFHVTHEFLSTMLGVRRVGVTIAASKLAQQGLITYTRGDLTVLDRSGLQAAACDCYATDCQVYRSHMKS